MKSFAAFLGRTVGTTLGALVVLGVMLLVSAFVTPALVFTVLFAPGAMIVTALVAILIPVLFIQIGSAGRPRGGAVLGLAVAALVPAAAGAWLAAAAIGPLLSSATWGVDAALLWTGPAAFAGWGAALTLRRRPRASAPRAASSASTPAAAARRPAAAAPGRSPSRTTR